MPVPDKKVFDASEELLGRLAELHDLLSDREVSTVRLVVNPEKMVIKEAQRSFTYLNLYGYVTDAVVCNRLLPKEVADSYFAHWQTAQRKYRRQIEEAFSPLPVLTAPLLEHEVVGVEGLRDLAQRLFGDDDPTRIYYSAVAQEVRSRDGEYELSLGMPFVEREEISLAQRGDELSIKVGSYKRQVLLPRALAGRRASSAKMDGDRLTISFTRGD
jgi:arsenite-transporting ATPase